MKAQHQIALKHRVVLLVAGLNPVRAIGFGKFNRPDFEHRGNAHTPVAAQHAGHADMNGFALGVGNLQGALANIIAGGVKGKESSIGIDQRAINQVGKRFKRQGFTAVRSGLVFVDGSDGGIVGQGFGAGTDGERYHH